MPASKQDTSEKDWETAGRGAATLVSFQRWPCPSVLPLACLSPRSTSNHSCLQAAACISRFEQGISLPYLLKHLGQGGPQPSSNRPRAEQTTTAYMAVDRGLLPGLLVGVFLSQPEEGKRLSCVHLSHPSFPLQRTVYLKTSSHSQQFSPINKSASSLIPSAYSIPKSTANGREIRLFRWVRWKNFW